jgi:hypothetical protein
MSSTKASQVQSGTAADIAVGAAYFAATLMILVGTFQSVQGFVALLNDDFYVVGAKWVFEFDITLWGWIHLGLGVLLVVAGILLFRGATWARWAAVVLAGVSAVLNFMWLPYYPLWSILVIAVDIAIVWALTVHGRAIDASLR